MTYKKQPYETVSTLAKKFGCSRQYIFELIKKKKIRPTHFVGNAYLFGRLRAKKIQEIYFPYTLEHNKTV